jgi:hypothetical protein
MVRFCTIRSKLVETNAAVHTEAFARLFDPLKKVMIIFQAYRGLGRFAAVTA